MTTPSTSFAARLRAVRLYAVVMQTPADLYRYARVRMRYQRGLASPPARIRVRTLGGATVVCRASQDVYTFKHTFLVGYHLPPVPLPRDATIVDLGSNVGYTVADFAHRYPAARVVGVEMDSANHALAVQNTSSFGSRVTVLHAAVWTHDGAVAYGGAGDDAFRVIDEPEAAPVLARESSSGSLQRTAPARRLSRILDECGVGSVDYMKIDIEGAEGPIFAAPLDWTDRVRVLKVEVHPPVTTEVVRRALESRGFTCWDDAQHPACVCAVKR